MKSHRSDPRIIRSRTKEMVETHLRNAQVSPPLILLQGAVEYDDALDLNIQEALLGRISVEEALNRTATAWERITEQVGRTAQIEAWKALRRAFPTKNVPD